MVNLGKVKMELEILKSQKTEIEKQIGELYSRQINIDNRIRERMEFIEREKYHGLLQWEYFSAISKTKFTEGEYEVIIGYFNSNGVYVSKMEGDMKVSVEGSVESKGGTMRLSREADYQKGTRWYEKRYMSYEIPKSRENQYREMCEIKNKYAQMMQDSKIKLPQEAK